MAETGGTLRAAIQRRVRDPSGRAHTDAVVLSLIGLAQRLVNAKTHALLQSTTINRVARRPLVQILAGIGTGIVRIESVRLGTRELPRVSWTSLQSHDPFWFRATASIPRVWDVIGRDLLLVWPALPIADASENLVVVYTSLTSGLGSEAGVMSIADQHVPALLAIVEQLLLLRQRLFGSLKSASERQGVNVDIGRAT